MMEIEPRMCNVVQRVVDEDVCYEILMCLTSGFKPNLIPETDFEDNEETERICKQCPHHHDWD